MDFLVISVTSKVTKSGKPYGVLRLFADSPSEKLLGVYFGFGKVIKEFDLYCWGFNPATFPIKVKPGHICRIANLTAFTVDGSGFVSCRLVFSPGDFITENIVYNDEFKERLERLIPPIKTLDDFDVLFKQVFDWVDENYQGDSVRSDWGHTLLKFFKSSILNLYPKYMKSYGAKSHHHAYPGGLANHTYQMMDMLLAIHKSFSAVTPVNLLYCAIGVFYHDFGKIQEYTEEGEYNLENLCMLGHPYISASYLSRKLTQIASKFSVDDKIESEITKIVHIVLSHHAIADHADWGSPVTPHSPEAFLVTHLDNLSGWGDKFNRPEANNYFYAL